MVRPEAWPIDPGLASVLKALHAQMDARALAAPQKDARGALQPACCSALAAGLFRCGAAAQHSSRRRKHTIENLSSTPARARTSTSSQGAFEPPRTAIPRPALRSTTSTAG